MYRKNTKLKGTVLFTVVSVMSILLIFLLSTLVLAASANKRSHKTYASTQTEYAARTAIESFFAAMESNDKIAEAVEKLDGTIYPTVNIDSKGFGDIFCYDDSTGAVLPNQIKVEKLSDEAQYIYTEATPGIKAGWSVYYPVRITANAQLGKEESSISAYIRKKAPNEPNENTVKGLQTVGMSNLTSPGSVITGGAGIGIIDDTPDDNLFTITNDPTFETELTYINGSLGGKTQMSINAVTAGTGTVIMGDVTIANKEFVKVSYDASTLTAMQQVPYLYVDGKLSFDDSCHITSDKDQPYNLFCGSIENTGVNNSEIEADVYLMDKDVTSNIGYINVTSKLKKWSDSVVTQTKQNFESKGGNIYSKGSVNLNKIDVEGDVRVEQNLQINGGSTIKGDIVVGETVTFDEEFTNKNKGKVIYCKYYNYTGPVSNPPAPPETTDPEGNPIETTPPAPSGSTEVTAEIDVNGVRVKPISDYTKSNAIYPPNMEKNVINGFVPNVDGENNKIIAQLADVRRQLDYKKYDEVDEHGNPTGNQVEGFDPNIYYTDFPKGLTGIEEFELSTLAEVVEITNNTHITGTGYKEGTLTSETQNAGTKDERVFVNYSCTYEKSKLTLNVKPIGDIWVKLTNVSVAELTINVDDSMGGTVNFLVDEHLDVDKLFMTTSNVYNDATVTEGTSIGVNWYSTGDTTKKSRFVIVNNGSVVGIAKAPYMDFYQINNTSFTKMTYKTSTGKELLYSSNDADQSTRAGKAPTWVGGALLNTAYSKNDFVMLDSGKGTGGGTLPTSVGDYKIMYFDH